MRLHPPEFTASPEEPFASDLLGRRQYVEGFCRMLLGIEGHAVISLDGAWGSGKSAFARMCAAYLRSEESRATKQVRVVEFNAWHQGHTGSPLVDLVSAISPEVDDKTKKALSEAVLKVGTRVVTQLVRAGTSGLLDLSELADDESQDMMTAWNEAEQGTRQFQTQLEEAASDEDGPLVVIIDELDRCQPSYALELLATVRHLFDVEDVIVVLAINRAELIHSVQSIYGPDSSADRYLRRFADLHAELPPPREPDLTRFLNNLLEEILPDPQTSLRVKKVLGLIGEAHGCGFRDIQQASSQLNAVLASFSGTHDQWAPGETSLICAVLIVLRTLDQETYKNISAGQIDGFKAIAAARRALSASHSSVADQDLCWFEAFLFTITSAVHNAAEGYVNSEISESEFSRSYQEATGGSGGNPTEVYGTAVRGGWYRDADTIKEVADLIDMIVVH